MRVHNSGCAWHQARQLGDVFTGCAPGDLQIVVGLEVDGHVQGGLA